MTPARLSEIRARYECEREIGVVPLLRSAVMPDIGDLLAEVERLNAELAHYEAQLAARDQQIALLREAIQLVLQRDGCRCDTSVCHWCNTDGWVQVSPDNVEKLRAALAEPTKEGE